MSDYTVTTDFGAKDILASGNANKVIKGSEFTTEFTNIATAIATKLNSGGALGTPSSVTLTNATDLPLSTGITGFGTGVATALAVNIGSAGAFTTFNGDLGTPSAVVLTNATGTAASLTAGAVTTNANLTGHVTSVGNAAVLGSFTLAQLNTAVSDATMAILGANTFTGLQTFAAGADIASAATVDLTAATGNTVVITGTTTTTALTMTAGQQMILLPSGAWPLTYHATTLNINGGVDYTCAAGDRIYATKDLAGVIRVTVNKQDGTPLVAPQGGSLVFISAASAAADASISFTGISAAYDSYIVKLLNVIPTTDADLLWMRTSTNGGSTYDNSAGYMYYNSQFVTTAQTGASGAAASIILTGMVGSVGGGELGISGDVLIVRPSEATNTQIKSSLDYFNSNAQGTSSACNGYRSSAADVDAVQFLFSSGTVASGLFALYGVQRA